MEKRQEIITTETTPVLVQIKIEIFLS